MLLLYILWDDWQIFFMISDSIEQIWQELKYTLLKPDLSQLVNFKNTIWILEEQCAIKFWDRVPIGSMLALTDQRTPDRANSPKLLITPFFDSTGMICMHWVLTGQIVNKEYYIEVLREFRKKFCRKRPALFKSGGGISTRTMHQSTTPSFSQTIWPRWTSRQFLSLPIV